MLTLARRCVQVAILLALLLLPVLSLSASLYQVYGPRGGHMARLSGGAWQGTLFRIADAASERFASSVDLADRTKGAPWAVTLLGYRISDPLAFLGHLAATKRFYAPLLLSILLPVAGAVLLGRVFCGWVCPFNTLSEATDGVRRLLRRNLGIPLPDVRIPRSLKYGLLAVGLLLALVGSVSLFPIFLPYVLFSREVASAVLFGTLTFGSGILLGLLLFEIFVAQRLWCRALCPSGALLGLLGRFSLLRVIKRPQACPNGCSTCRLHCPMALAPNHGYPASECMQCGRCISHCPQGLLQFNLGWSKPGQSKPLAETPAKTSKRVLVAGLLAGLVLLTWTSGAPAHHVRGLPHYGYAENYPQVPTQETRGVVGDYELLVASYFFEGLRREKSDTPNDVQMYVSLRRRATGQSYTGPLTLSVREGETTLATFERQTPDEEVVYKIRYPYSGSHRFILVVEARANGTIHRGQVVLQVGKSTWTKYYAAVALLLLLGICMAALRPGLFQRRRSLRR